MPSNAGGNVIGVKATRRIIGAMLESSGIGRYSYRPKI